MSSYKITKYTLNQAKKLGVTVKPSTRKDKKIDVFKNDEKIASIGGIRQNGEPYKDFPTWTQEKGLAYAKERRRLYRIRHKGEEKDIGSPGFYAWMLLW